MTLVEGMETTSCIDCGVSITVYPPEDGYWTWRCGRCAHTATATPVRALFSAAHLMAMTFTYDDALRDMVRLIENSCSPECLFADPDTVDTCTCRCNGGTHGEIHIMLTTPARVPVHEGDT